MKKRLLLWFLLAFTLLLTLCLGLYLALNVPMLEENLRSDAVAYAVCLYLVLLLIGALLGLYLTRRLTAPISGMDPRHPPERTEYSELQPMLDRLREQNRTICRQNAIMTREREDFAAITENMSEGFLLLDRRLNVVSCNASARHLFSPADADNADNLNTNGCPREIRDAAEKAVTGQRSGLTVRRDGRYLYVVASPVLSDSQVTGAAVLLLDTTEQEERELLRREFTANVSHELKTPLTSINGFAELLKSGMVEPDRVGEFAGDIYRESQRLIALVNDILELGRLEENRQLPEPETVELFSAAAEVLNALTPAAERKQVAMTLQGDHGEIRGYPAVVEEMIYNLCDNAIKYNRINGQVTVCVTEAGDEVRISVADTGIGIPPEHQSRVFERFYRVDKSHSRSLGGTGLGLSIVKHGAVLHRARLVLQSVPGRGTTVTVSFPKEK